MCVPSLLPVSCAYVKKKKKRPSLTSTLVDQLGSIALPFVILSGANAYRLWDEHWEHWNHMPPLEDRVEYSYQNIRTKNFPWGDGDKTLLYVYICVPLLGAFSPLVVFWFLGTTC